jgi:hypothetical protein
MVHKIKSIHNNDQHCSHRLRPSATRVNQDNRNQADADPSRGKTSTNLSSPGQPTRPAAGCGGEKEMGGRVRYLMKRFTLCFIFVF